MITTLGNVGGEDSSRSSQAEAETGTHRVIKSGSRQGQLVDVVQRRRNGDVVCVYQGNRFVFPESGLEVVAEEAIVEEVKVAPKRRRTRKKK